MAHPGIGVNIGYLHCRYGESVGECCLCVGVMCACASVHACMYSVCMLSGVWCLCTIGEGVH